MKDKISTIVNIFTMLLKYSAVIIAVIKGIEVINDELKKINEALPEKTNKDAK